MDFCEWGKYSGLAQCNHEGSYSFGGWVQNVMNGIAFSGRHRYWPLCNEHYTAARLVDFRVRMR